MSEPAAPSAPDALATPAAAAAKKKGPRPGTIAPEHLATAIEYYQSAMQVQMHYNEMLLRIRSLGLTAAATLLAVAGGAAGGIGGEAADQRILLIGGATLQVSGVFGFCALLLTAGLFVMDRFYYYRLFIAAAKNAVAYEVDNPEALQAIGVRRNPLTLHLVMTVPELWSDVFVALFWAVPAIVSIVFVVAALG